jgi:formate dehydrogenase major subunit
MDMKHADAIMIMGSNMAECHPVAFRWVMQAKTRDKTKHKGVDINPCKVIHVDPRFTRTSAMADVYAPLRAGSDIAFLGGLIKYVLDHHEKIFEKKKDGEELNETEKFFHDYIVHYTNAATRITDEFKDTEDVKDADDGSVRGVFAGFKPNPQDPTLGTYDVTAWRYSSEPKKKPTVQPEIGEAKGHSWSAQTRKLVGKRPVQDLTLRAGEKADDKEPCVWQILRRHYRRYTPEMVEQVCGTPKEKFLEVAKTLLGNAGPHHTGAICYAVGWTQHTVGVQMIRAAAVLQLLLGNVGRPGGGILALRGHATIQGSTDIATLFNIHPGYLNTPSALRPHDNLFSYIMAETSPTSYWSNFPKFIISQLIAWYGKDAVEDPKGQFAYDYLPKIIGDHSHMQMFVDMNKGIIKGFFAMGQNPAVGGQNASYQRQALAKLDWMVVRDLYETETASFWKDSPEVKGGKLRTEDIKTEVFFLPAAAVAEMDGSFTNTQRLVQWHDKAVDPKEDCRSDLWFTYHLGRLLKELYAKDKPRDRDRPIMALRWDYLDKEANKKWRIKDEPSADLVMKEINGYIYDADKSIKECTALSSFAELKDDGKPHWTACGAWIYTGIYAGGKNHAASRKGDNWVALGWGFSWPLNRRLMYNRASADPAGNPWPKEARLARSYPGGAKGYVYWDGEKWTGLDVPDFGVKKSPTDKGDDKKLGLDYLDGVSPFIMKADGKGWLYVPNGLVDGPLPTHYEPYESPVANAFYKQQSNPTAKVWKIEGNPYASPTSEAFPHVLSTYRLTEHHLSGVMSRWLPWLVELQPELFCEISPEHAESIGVKNTEWVEISTPRAAIRAKALVTRRIRPYKLKDKTVHHVGLPWHWGYKGLTSGDVVNNLSALVGDPNVTIHEAKVFVCQVKKVSS